MKVDFVLELGYEDFRGDFVCLAEAPLYYSGLKLQDGTQTKLGGTIVSRDRGHVIDVLNSCVKDNPHLNQAWLSYRGFNIGIFNYKDNTWQLIA